VTDNQKSLLKTIVFGLATTLSIVASIYAIVQFHQPKPAPKMPSALKVHGPGGVELLEIEIKQTPPPVDAAKPDGPKQPTGYVPNPEGTKKFLGTLDKPTIREAGPDLFKAVPGTTPDGVFLYRPLQKQYQAKYGKPWVVGKQMIGDCVSWGWMHGVAIGQAINCELGDSSEFDMPATEAIYGGARVEASGSPGDGRNPYGGWGDGSYGGVAAKCVHGKPGVLWRRKYDFADLTVYSGERAKQWGAYGCGGQNDNGKADKEAANFTVAGVALVRTFEEAAAAIKSGYPVPVCSGQGFSSRRDADGFAAPSGSWSHCFIPGTIIGTEVPMSCENVQIGDQVMTHTGEFHTVEQVFVRPHVGKVITLEMGCLPDITATPEHPMLIYRPLGHHAYWKPGIDMLTYSNGKYAGSAPTKAAHDATNPRWVQLAEVQQGDYMLVPVNQTRPDTMPVTWPVNDRAQKQLQPIVPGDDMAFLFGMYVANGNVRKDHGISITLPNPSPHVDRLLSAIESMGLEGKLAIEETYIRIRVDSVIIEQAFREWFGEDSGAKHFPTFIRSKQWNWNALLDGYSAGDGTPLKNHRTRITTISPALAHQVWEMAVALKMWPSMYKIRADRPGVYANAKESVAVEFGTEPKRKTTLYWDQYYCVPVRDVIAKDYSGPVYNFEVEKDHTYLAGGVIAHNCMCFVGWRGGKRPGLLCLNSWGPGWISGPKYPDDQPDGSFWVDVNVVNSMLRGNDSFAVSGVRGFPFRDLSNGDWVRVNPRVEAAETQFVLAP